MTEQTKEALGNGCLQEGEYLIPDGYSVKKVGRTLQVHKSKGKRLCDGEYRCKDCKHYVSGYSSNSAWYETMVCELIFKRTTKEGRPCYKAVKKYAMPCEKFERKED